MDPRARHAVSAPMVLCALIMERATEQVLCPATERAVVMRGGRMDQIVLHAHNVLRDMDHQAIVHSLCVHKHVSMAHAQHRISAHV